MGVNWRGAFKREWAFNRENTVGIRPTLRRFIYRFRLRGLSFDVVEFIDIITKKNLGLKLQVFSPKTLKENPFLVDTNVIWTSI